MIHVMSPLSMTCKAVEYILEVGPDEACSRPPDLSDCNESRIET